MLIVKCDDRTQDVSCCPSAIWWRWARTASVLIGGLVTLCLVVRPAVSVERLQFNRDIRPILSDKCFACHGPDAGAREAELRLDKREDAVADRGGYQVVDTLDPSESELLIRILSDDDDEQMPPAEFEKPLTDQERATLVRWIKQGGDWQEHWSLIPPVRPPLPIVKNTDWVKNPVDAFVISRLEQAGVDPSEPADTRTLLRRLSFDLTGLPATWQEIKAFSASPSEQAYGTRVEELLSSPHYGERMAIYWLDLVRYADTLGYHGDQVRSVSPYRDYVIGAFNDNLPFDQFTVENLAGDLIPNATLAQRVASTYNRLNRASAEGGVQPKEYLAKYASDRVRTTGGVWLGATLGCAECHDHKFDPFTSKDFYGFEAFFADIKEQGIVPGAKHIALFPVPTLRQQQEMKRLDSMIASAEADFTSRTPARQEAFSAWLARSVSLLDRWTVLHPVAAQSRDGSNLQILEDGVVQTVGKSPEKDVYTITVAALPSDVAAVRLELIPDTKLPQKGPGRADNGNVVVQAFEWQRGGKAIRWDEASASHSQSGFPIANLAKGDAKGWAILPETGKRVTAVFVPNPARKPENADRGEPKVSVGPWTFTIRQEYGARHTIGRFRLAVALASSNEPAPVDWFASVSDPEFESKLRKPAGERTEVEQKQLWDRFRQRSAALATERDRLAELRVERKKIDSAVITTLATSAGTPREIRVLPRGDWMNTSGEVVVPAVPQSLPQPKNPDGRRLTRLDLAHWLTSRDNPLVARVFVNRLWMLFFGQGLSPSVDDLGSQGQWPTHPLLLDWLAVEFMESGWDVKHVIRLIVTSNTYRQSSFMRSELRERDPSNRLLARQGRWRLEAELVRDNALATSGLLVRAVGGPSVKPYQPAGYWAQLNFPKRTYSHDKGDGQYRRGLYTHWQRTFLHPSLLAFDGPVREECTAKRERSNTPLQALVLLNDPTYVEAARVLAEQVIRSDAPDVTGRIRAVYRRVLARDPSAAELTLLTDFQSRSSKALQNRQEDARKLIQSGLAPVGEGIDPVELASWTAVARAVYNLHETITRY